MWFGSGHKMQHMNALWWKYDQTRPRHFHLHPYLGNHSYHSMRWPKSRSYYFSMTAQCCIWGKKKLIRLLLKFAIQSAVPKDPTTKCSHHSLLSSLIRGEVPWRIFYSSRYCNCCKHGQSSFLLAQNRKSLKMIPLLDRGRTGNRRHSERATERTPFVKQGTDCDVPPSGDFNSHLHFDSPLLLTHLLTLKLHGSGRERVWKCDWKTTRGHGW